MKKPSWFNIWWSEKSKWEKKIQRDYWIIKDQTTRNGMHRKNVGHLLSHIVAMDHWPSGYLHPQWAGTKSWKDTHAEAYYAKPRWPKPISSSGNAPQVRHWHPAFFINTSKFRLNTCNKCERVWRCQGKHYAACNVIQRDWLGGVSVVVCKDAQTSPGQIMAPWQSLGF